MQVVAAAHDWASGHNSVVHILELSGAIHPGTSSELEDTLQTVRVQQLRGEFDHEPEGVEQLARLWEWVERTGIRPAVKGWPYFLPTAR